MPLERGEVLGPVRLERLVQLGRLLGRLVVQVRVESALLLLERTVLLLVDLAKSDLERG